MNNTLRVGVMSLFALGLMVAFVFTIGDLNPFDTRISFTVTFGHVDGLLSGGKVTLAGVKIGTVTDMRIQGNRVRLTLQTSTTTPIPGNSKFTIDTSGLMGEKYVGIELPKGRYDAPIQAGVTLEGTDPLRLTQLFSSGREIIDDIKAGVADFRDILKPENRAHIDHSLANVDKALDEFRKLAADGTPRLDKLQKSLQDALDVFADAGEQVRDLVDDLSFPLVESAMNMNDLTYEASRMVKENRAPVHDMVDGMRDASRKVADLFSKVDADGKTSADFRRMVEGFRETGTNLAKITKDIRHLFDDGGDEDTKETALPAAGDGTRSKKDPAKVGSDGRGKAPRSQAKRSVRRVRGLMRSARKVFDTIQRLSMKVSFVTRIDQKTRSSRNDLGLKILEEGGPGLHLGVRNVGHGNQLDLQLSKGVSTSFAGRMGILRGKIGAGVDYVWKPGSIYSVDVIDTEKTSVETTSLYEWRKGIFLFSRVEDALRKSLRNYNLGIKLEY